MFITADNSEMWHGVTNYFRMLCFSLYTIRFISNFITQLPTPPSLLTFTRCLFCLVLYYKSYLLCMKFLRYCHLLFFIKRRSKPRKLFNQNVSLWCRIKLKDYTNTLRIIIVANRADLYIWCRIRISTKYICGSISRYINRKRE